MLDVIASLCCIFVGILRFYLKNKDLILFSSFAKAKGEVIDARVEDNSYYTYYTYNVGGVLYGNHMPVNKDTMGFVSGYIDRDPANNEPVQIDVYYKVREPETSLVYVPSWKLDLELFLFCIMPTIYLFIR